METYHACQPTHNGIQKGEKGAERICEEIMAENFPKFVEAMNLHIQEARQTLGGINSYSHQARHIIIKSSNPKRLWKTPRKK